MNLFDLSQQYGSDKGDGGGHFTRFYERLFSPIKDDVKQVLEIGIWKGASLRMWRDYFPKAKITGVDCLFDTMFSEDRIKTYHYDMSCDKGIRRFLAEVCASQGYDIIIDDASHRNGDQQRCLVNLFPSLNGGGMHVIEDIAVQQIHPLDRADLVNSSLQMFFNMCSGKIPENIHINKEEALIIMQDVLSAEVYLSNMRGALGVIVKK